MMTIFARAGVVFESLNFLGHAQREPKFLAITVRPSRPEVFLKCIGLEWYRDRLLHR